MSSRGIGFFLGVLALAQVDATGGVITVDDNGGPLVTTTSITSAITMAADGDIILVAAGTYSGFTVADKSLVITAALGANVKINGSIQLIGLSRGKSLVMRGLVTGVPAANSEGLRIEGCAGEILIESCTVLAGNGSSPPRPGTRILDSHAVSLVRVDSKGGLVTGTFTVGDGGAGLQAVASDIKAYDCKLRGATGLFGDDLGGRGGDGVSLSFSNLFASGCLLAGGDGGNADDDIDFFTGGIVCGVPGTGGASIRLAGIGDVTTLECRLEPGDAGLSASKSPCPNGSSGVDYSGPVSALHSLSGKSSELLVTSPLVERHTGEIRVEGTPGDIALLAIGSTLKQTPLPPLPGILFAPLESVIVFGVVPTSGMLSTNFVAPKLPSGLDAATFLAQGIFLSPSGPTIGSGSHVVVLADSL